MKVSHLPGRCRVAGTHAKILSDNRRRLAGLLAAAIVAAITTLSGPAHAGADGSAAGFVYTANEYGNSISAMELNTSRPSSARPSVAAVGVGLGRCFMVN